MDFTKILMEHFTLVGRDGEMWRKVNGYVLAFVVGSVFHLCLHNSEFDS